MWFRAIFSPRNKAHPATASSGLANLVLSAPAIRQLDRLRLSAGRYLPGYAVGLRPSLRRKPAAEFQQHRMYVPGDDVRFVDWKASARAEHIFVKQGEQPKEATVYLLLDCSASMAWGSPPKSQAALQLALALAYLALSHGDRFMLVPFTSKIGQPLGPLSGKGQLPTMVNALRALKFSGKTDLLQTTREFNRRFAQSGGLTLIISDLLGSESAEHLAAALGYTPAPTWETVVLHLLHQEELTPSLHGDYEMEDAETGQLANYDIDMEALQSYQQRLQGWFKSLELVCNQSNTFYTQISSAWALDSQVIPHLRSVNIVRPL
jgi:uncharacterized protein (DUF58 family)